jgi:hypothetical protein
MDDRLLPDRLSEDRKVLYYVLSTSPPGVPATFLPGQGGYASYAEVPACTPPEGLQRVLEQVLKTKTVISWSPSILQGGKS